MASAQAASFGGNCVLYARHASGIALDGNAGAWWSNAAGRYERGQTPAVGAVLVFKPSGHMRVGHVAVVSRVVAPREILVDQANWLRGRVVKNMSVVDASPDNDWTAVKVLELRSGTHGRANATYGFVYPRTPRAIDGDRVLVAAGADAARRRLPVRNAVALSREPTTVKQHRTRPAVERPHARPATAKRAPQPKHTTPRIEGAARRG